LSQKAVQILRSVDGIGCVLVGAKRQNYVEEMIDILNLKSVSGTAKIFKKLQKNVSKEE
jgi:aryl-alcohol dehydrogenase-like predicted oxidoreductase